jgi:hypothetical protein
MPCLLIEMGSGEVSALADLEHDSPALCLPSSWDYMHKAPHPAIHLLALL